MLALDPYIILFVQCFWCNEWISEFSALSQGYFKAKWYFIVYACLLYVLKKIERNGRKPLARQYSTQSICTCTIMPYSIDDGIMFKGYNSLNGTQGDRWNRSAKYRASIIASFIVINETWPEILMRDIIRCCTNSGIGFRSINLNV